MCGIAGVYSPGAVADVAAVGPMLASMSHRGPDDSGVQVLAGGELVFGHLRLSILDLSPLGHQPMATSDQKTWIVFNGEIYNFRELRSDLQSLGWAFRSDSDTEVVLAAYRAWGLKAVERFHGMFAFALWDATQGVLHLCRDRFGVKPLYFSLRCGRLAFASEMKALIYGGVSARAVDSNSLANFVQYGYICAPRSIFADVQVVRPGMICTFDARLKLTEHCYWSAKALYDGERATGLRSELARLSDEELLDRTELTLQRAFSYRMVADVPVGIFLSGGIDSSLVTALLAKTSSLKLKTFTIGFSGSEFDESVYARAVAKTLGTEHVEFDVSAQSALQTAADIVDIADEPIGDSSLIPTLMVSRLARQYVKVALSADGADELFGGYARYAHCGRFVERSPLVHGVYALSGAILDSLPRQVVARSYALSRGRGPRFAAISDKLRKFVRMSQSTREFDAYDCTISEWPAQEAHALLAHGPLGIGDACRAYESVDGVDPRDRFMHFDTTRYLPGDLLVKVDRASMATSLEAREPFLDQEIAALAAALPMKWKIRGTKNKYILRRLLHRHLPPALYERPKQGFSAPIGEWLRGPLRPLLRDELSVPRVREYGILDPDVVDAAVKRFLSADRHSGSAAGLWILLQLQQWAARWGRLPSKPIADLRAGTHRVLASE
jgi:asparagine synthase (glutamine-hydrolysing)